MADDIKQWSEEHNLQVTTKEHDNRQRLLETRDKIIVGIPMGPVGPMGFP